MEGERKKSMYRKDSEGWLKHTDFIILDMICLQLAYVLAYAISGYGFNPYETIIYRNMAVFLELADLVMIFAYGTMKSVLKRKYPDIYTQNCTVQGVAVHVIKSLQ